MALEQLRAFYNEEPQEALGPVDRLPPDGYPLLRSSELRTAHERIFEVVESGGYRTFATELNGWSWDPKFLKPLIPGNDSDRTQDYLALLERIFAFDAGLSSSRDNGHAHSYGHIRTADILVELFDRGVDVQSIAGPTLEWFRCYRFSDWAIPVLERVCVWIAGKWKPEETPAHLKELLASVRGQFSDVGTHHSAILPARIDEVIGDGFWRILVPCEKWSESAKAYISSLTSAEEEAWVALLRHARRATAPSLRLSG